MAEFLFSMPTDPVLRVYWVVMVASTLAFVLQTLISFIGFDADTDFSGGDTSFDLNGYSLFTIKSLTYFLLGFGWSGFLFFRYIPSLWLLGALSVGCGLLLVGLIFLVMGMMLRLSKDNTFRIEQTVGVTASVYLHIPAGGQGVGKVTVSVNGSTHELEALTQGDALPTGATVRITKVIDSSRVEVEAIPQQH